MLGILLARELGGGEFFAGAIGGFGDGRAWWEEGIEVTVLAREVRWERMDARAGKRGASWGRRMGGVNCRCVWCDV